MVKLIIQIPCYNEEKTLPLVLKSIPKKIEGIDIIETQIIDDGCTDNTIEIAKKYRVNHIVSYIGNKGLGNAFKVGVENALKNGADVLVNTDGDNQYKSSDIPGLVKPILERKADIVIGNRQTDKIKHFSLFKKFLQKAGSRVVQYLAGISIPDAVSGFRAYSKEALLQLNITSSFSYVLDTTIQAGHKRIKLEYVNIETNPPTRPSRLFDKMSSHIKKSINDMFSVYTMYRPLRTFFYIGSVFVIIGLIPIIRFLYYYFMFDDSGKIQSLIFGMMFEVIGFQFFGLGIISHLMEKQRQLTEDALYRVKKITYKR